MNKVLFAAVFFPVACLMFAQDVTKPVPPVNPETPVVPGVTGGAGVPGRPAVPAFPGMPNRNNQSGSSIYEVEKYLLNVTEAYSNGNTRNNVANTVSGAQYTLYSNKTIILKFSFTGGADYFYHLRNPRSKIETSENTYRELYDVIIQTGGSFSLVQYTGELYFDNNSITAFNLINNNRITVHLVFSKEK